jgi:hypothetical protein
MKPKSYRFKLTFAAGILGASFASGSVALAKTISFIGSGTFTFVTSSFTYDGAAPGALLTGSENTNLGSATFQTVVEQSPSAVACTAPDGSAGTIFNLVQTDTVLALRKGQLYSTAAGAAGNQCISSTTEAGGGSVTYTVTGGSGAFTGASGSYLVTFTSQTLAAPGSPPGANGLFGAGRFTFNGSLTK